MYFEPMTGFVWSKKRIKNRAGKNPDKKSGKKQKTPALLEVGGFIHTVNKQVYELEYCDLGYQQS